MAIIFPDSPVEGQVYFDTHTRRYYMWNNSNSHWDYIKDYASKDMFVIRLYEHILDRKFDDAGRIYWIRYLSDTSDTMFLRQLYELALERNPSGEEMEQYLTYLAETGDRKGVIEIGRAHV